MVDDSSAAIEPSGSVCPWCSARYTGDPDSCPSCGAALAVDPATDPALPGLTAIDPAAIVRSKAPVARPRSRLLSWISGDYGDDRLTPVEAGALAPPALDVRREMLRLELAAEVANLQAEADALLADATVEGHAPQTSAGTAPAATKVVEDADAGSAELEAVEDVDAAPAGDSMVDEDRRPA
jgi:hypothetical protein